MAAVPYAHIVAQLLEGKHPKGSEIALAPNPKDIVSEIILALTAILMTTHVDLGKSE